MRKRAIRLALVAARKQGCVCKPDVAIRWPAPGVPYVGLGHDDWCPLLRAQEGNGASDGPSDVVIYLDEPPLD